MQQKNLGLQEELYALEERRIAAINAGDSEALSLLLSDDYQQVHANGRIDTKASVLEFVASRRGDAEARRPEMAIYGNVAILKGVAVHRAMIDGAAREFTLFGTQIAVCEDKVWRFVHMQATLLPAS